VRSRSGRVAVALSAAALALACGRTELDWAGSDNVPAATGVAGAGEVTGAAGAGAPGVAGAPGIAGAPGAAGRSGGAGAAGTTGAAGRSGGAGRGGTAGTTGAAGRTGTAGTGGTTPVPCGAGAACVPGMQTCCIRLQGAQAGASCIPVGQTCDMGTTIGCLDSASCGSGNVCCVSQMLSTSCSRPATCLVSAGLILCRSDADCQSPMLHCCGNALRICTPQPCNGMGGRGR
jgi:hypothetical protein